MRFSTTGLSLWGYSKVRVYMEPIESIAVLNLKIPDMTRHITKKWLKILMKESDICNRERDEQLSNINWHLLANLTLSRICNKNFNNFHLNYWFYFVPENKVLFEKPVTTSEL